MRKILIMIGCIVAVLAVAVLGASAVGDFRTNANCPNMNQNDNYVDSDNNGVCDNREESGKNCGNGICNQENGNYVDADNNGVCDNREESGKNCGNSICNQKNENYVDADNDGVCDNRNGNGKHNGNRNGNGKHHGKH